MKYLKNSLNYIFIFLFSLTVLIFITTINEYDAIWNYGFSYAFSKGQIPFKEFNSITPGLYSFLTSLGLLISKNNIIFLIEHSILITIAFHFLYKLYEDKAWLFLFFMCFYYFYAFTPTYNFLLLFFLIIVIYLERIKANDYLIGLFLGLLILTKHTVGIFLIIPSLIFYFNNKKKIFKRTIGILIPCSIFSIYLLLNNALLEFFNLCFFGLLDFGKNNGDYKIFYLVGTSILLILNLLYIRKNKDDILGYYILFFSLIMPPIFSYYHFSYYLVAFSLLLINKININKKLIKDFSIITSLMFFLIYNRELSPNYKFLKLNNFNFYYISAHKEHKIVDSNNLYKKYKKQGNVKILSSLNPIITAINNDETDYFLVFLNGNFGYNGIEEMNKKIKKFKKTYFIIDVNEYETTKKYGGQYAIEIVDYIIKNSKLIEKNKEFKVFLYGGSKNYE